MLLAYKQGHKIKLTKTEHKIFNFFGIVIGTLMLFLETAKFSTSLYSVYHSVTPLSRLLDGFSVLYIKNREEATLMGLSL